MKKLILPIVGLLLSVTVTTGKTEAKAVTHDLSEDGVIIEVEHYEEPVVNTGSDAYAEAYYEEEYDSYEFNEGTIDEKHTLVYPWDGPKLAPGIGTVYGPTGKETYYNQNMTTLVSWARDAGLGEEEYPYWIREDGCKMLGKYIMVAANLDHFPRYSLVETSLGTGIVVDTGDFIYYDEGWSWLDLATTW